MGACQSAPAVSVSDVGTSKAVPELIPTEPVQDSDVSEKGRGPPSSDRKTKRHAREGSDAVGLIEIRDAMKADGPLHEAVVRMETPIGIPIEEVYDGVHDGDVLGSGVSGVVRQVKHKATGISYASKSIDLGLIKSAESLEQLRNEISIMCQCDHPNIVRLEEVYESESEIYLVMELCEGGDLFDRLDEMPDYHYTENQCARLVKQMLSSLIYLHSKEIIHRDLKLENFLFSSRKQSSELKLIDFGLSKHFHFGEMEHEAVGTPYTVAPEVIKGSYDERSDLWAIGVIIFLLLSGETPFGGCDGENLLQVRNNILRGSFSFEPQDIWENVSAPAKDVIRRLLVVDYHKRPSARDILKHTWIARVNGYEIGTESMHGSGLNPNVVNSLISFKEYSDMRKLLLEILSFTLLPDQIIGLRADFEKLDADGDGEISLGELKQMLVANAEAGCLGSLTNEEVEQIFDAMRVRKSETSIRWHEFIAASLSQCKVDDRNLRLAFNRLDTSGRGFITFDNIMNLVGSNGNRDELQKMWRDSVKNECSRSDDERIYYDDFVLLMKGQTKDDMRQSQMILSARVTDILPDNDERGAYDIAIDAAADDIFRRKLNFDADNLPADALANGRARSMEHVSERMDSDDEEEYSGLRPPAFAAQSARAVILPGRRGSKDEVEHVIKDETKSPLVVNKTLYRSHREMRLAVLEASMRFEEKQKAHAKRAGLTMRRGSCRAEQELLATAKKRCGRRRYRTCSDLTGMVMVPDS